VLNAVAVTSLDLPALAPFRTLRRPEEHLKAGIFVAEGGPVVERLLLSGLPALSFLLTPQWLEKLRPRLEAHAGEAALYIAEKDLLEGIVGVRLHQGVMAIGRIPAPRLVSEVIEAARRPRLVVALDGITNPENLGSIARSCAAFEVSALLVGETGASPWLRRAVRTSMGAILKLPVCHVTDLAAAVASLRTDHGLRVLATSPVGAASLYDTDLRGDCCLVLGHEGYGVRPTVLEACDGSVGIAMPEGVDSLNVGAAAAVVVYEASRQRRA
jgi:tRNA G18 (ribose-2'-O)-methylase SpoU